VPQIPGGVTDRRRMTDGRCNPALLRPQIGYILTPTLGTGQNHPYSCQQPAKGVGYAAHV
jgi:hypothetical protein